MVACLAAIVLSAAPPPRDSGAEVHREAAAHFKARRYVEAARGFRRAHDLAPSAGALWNEALAWQAAGDAALARGALEDYLALPGPELKAAQRWAGDLERALSRTHGRLAFIGLPPGAQVLVDGVPFSRATWLRAGPHRVRAAADGYMAWEGVVEVAPGQQRQESLSLAPLPRVGTLRVRTRPSDAEVSIDGEPAGRGPEVSVSLKAGRHVVSVRAPSHTATEREVAVTHGESLGVEIALVPDAPATPAQPVTTSRPEGLGVAGWSTLGAGVAAAGVGLGLHLLRNDKATQANGLPPGDGARYDALAQDVERLTRSAGVLYGLGAAAVTTAIVLLVLDHKGTDSGVAAVGLPGGGLVLLGGAF